MAEPIRAEEDYPHVRSSNVCPLCGERKESGLVACWSCYSAHGLRYGNREAEALIEQAEIRLKRLCSSAQPN
jgi:hypothetical protein